MLVNFGGETAVQNKRCSTHRVEVGDREHHRNGKKDNFLRSQHQEPRTLFGEFGFWILFFVNLVTSQPKWYFTWSWDFVKWSLSMLAGVITILQCMIYFILSFFFPFFNSGVCLDQKILGIRTFSFSEYWRFERKTLFALISHQNEWCFRIMQQVMGEQKVPKPDWYVQVDNSSEEIEVNRSSGLDKCTKQWNKLMKW